MSQSYQECPAQSSAPKDFSTEVCTGDTARGQTAASRVPSTSASAALPNESSQGADAAYTVLEGSPIAEYYYESIVLEPTVATREALFVAFLNNWPGFNAMLATVDLAAMAELADLKASGADPGRSALLGAVRAGIASGKQAYRSSPLPLEMDVLLGHHQLWVAGREASRFHRGRNSRVHDRRGRGERHGHQHPPHALQPGADHVRQP